MDTLIILHQILMAFNFVRSLSVAQNNIYFRIPEHAIDRKINDVSFKSLFPCGLIQCARECLSYKLCRSVSLLHWECSLNYGAIDNFPLKMTDSQGALYLERNYISSYFTDECRNHNCSLDERCVIIHDSSAICLRHDLLKSLWYDALHCPAGWHYFSASCYYISTNSVPANTASTECKNLQADEASVETMEELNFIYSKLSAGEYALGLHDTEVEGTFIWTSSGKPLEYFGEWNEGEPDNWGPTGEDCTQIQSVRKWGDIQCNSVRRFICELTLEMKLRI